MTQMTPPTHKLPLPKIGDQVYEVEGGEEFGAVRELAPNGEPEIVIYVENAGDFTLPIEAIASVHDGKVIVHAASITPELRAAIAHAHDKEEE